MLKRFLPLALALLAPLASSAWGVDGHRAVGRIAERHLTTKARQAVQRLLGTETLPLVSTFPDEIRYYPEFKETAPWHYVNTAPGLNQEQYLTELRGQQQPNAYNMLLVKLKEVKDPSKTTAEQAVALKFIVHLVGDAHQPLHSGHAEDKGGNDIKLKFRGKDTNLHSLWDSGLLDYQGLTYTEMGQAYDNKLPRTLTQVWEKAPVEQWFWESYQASEQLYREAPTGTDIDYKYYPAHSQLMQVRIQQAGIRLAKLLNETLG